MKKDKMFYAIPGNISKMSDEEIEEWAKSVYQDFVQSAKKEFRRLRFFN